jgi:hypothetical protein
MVAESDPARVVAPVPVKSLFGALAFIRVEEFFHGPFGLLSSPKKLARPATVCDFRVVAVDALSEA